MATRDISAFLGVPDEEIIRPILESWTYNTIGGTAVYMHEGETLKPGCTSCDRGMSLALQLYCPLLGVVESRVLYVWVCVSRQCQNSPHSWRVFRSQKVDDVKSEGTKSPGHATNWNDEMTDDWGGSGDEWGEEADGIVMEIGWSNAHNNPEICRQNGKNVACSEMTLEDDFSAKATISARLSPSRRDTAVIAVDNVKVDDTAVAQNVDDQSSCENTVTGVDRSEYRLSRDAERSAANVSLSAIESHGMMKELLKQEVAEDAKLGAVTATEVEFRAFFIAVVPEAACGSQNDVHVKTLLKDYEYMHGVVESAPVSLQSNHGAEVYEKSQITHGDRTFHKFISCLSSCPQQCLRYQWNGTPLLSSPLPGVTPICSNCGGESVFELQLTPGLISALIAKSPPNPDIDFATVLVYTCKASCWREGSVFTEETTTVLPDSYHKLLK